MSSSNRNDRLRRDQRSKTPARMRETDNDRQIVQLVYDYRVLSQNQIERLMARSRSTIQRLLRRLYDHGYLERVFLPIAHFGSSPAMYVLDRKGIELLQRMGMADFTGVPNKTLSGMYLEHTLAMNEFRIAVSQACTQHAWQIVKWVSENEIKAGYDRVRVPGKKRPVALLPDSYFSIRVPDRGVTHFFLELDRGTMTVPRFREKVLAYVAYYKSGGYAKRYGARGFRVLTVVDGIGSGRVDNLAQASSEVRGIGRRFWFAHRDDLTAKTVFDVPVWQIAGADDKLALFPS